MNIDTNDRIVNVSSTAQVVTYLDKHNNEQTLGHVVVDEFNGEGVRKFGFQPVSNNPYADKRKRENGYSLGVGTDKRLSFVNPADAQRAILDIFPDYELVDQYATEGGSELVSYYKGATALQDPIRYDLDVWEPRNGLLSQIHPLIAIKTSIRIGRMAVEYIKGFWRLICTNGLYGAAMALPLASFRHTDFTIEKVQQQLLGWGSDNLLTDGLNHTPVVASMQDLHKAYDLLNRYQDAIISDDHVMLAKFEPLSRVVSIFRDTVVKQAWLLPEYINQLGNIIFNSQGKNVYALDLVNAFTSAVNLHRAHESTSTRGAFNAFALTEPTVNATSVLASVAGFFNSELSSEKRIFDTTPRVRKVRKPAMEITIRSTRVPVSDVVPVPAELGGGFISPNADETTPIVTTKPDVATTITTGQDYRLADGFIPANDVATTIGDAPVGEFAESNRIRTQWTNSTNLSPIVQRDSMIILEPLQGAVDLGNLEDAPEPVDTSEDDEFES